MNKKPAPKKQPQKDGLGKAVNEMQKKLIGG